MMKNFDEMLIFDVGSCQVEPNLFVETKIAEVDLVPFLDPIEDEEPDEEESFAKFGSFHSHWKQTSHNK